MRKLVALLLVLFMAGCQIPQVVFDDLKIARDNLEIQQEIKEDLLNAIDPGGDFVIMEAITQEKIEMELSHRATAEAMNRIINYLSADSTVDYMVAVFDFLRNDVQVKDLYERWKEGSVDE